MICAKQYSEAEEPMIKTEEVKEQFRGLKLRLQQSFHKFIPNAMEPNEESVVAPVVSQKFNGVRL